MDETYELFDLRIFRGGGGSYPIEVLRSPAGEAAGECKLPFDLDEIGHLLEQLETGEADRQQLKEIGQQLYRMLFIPPIERRYRESLAGLKDGVGLRVRLRLDPPELTRLPWEFLCDPQDGEYLTLSPHAPFVRYVSGGEVEPLQVEAPVRLLLVTSSPADMPPLDTAKEITLVNEALAEQIEKGMYVVEVLEKATLSRLADKLRENFHILHYLGHAYLDPDSGQGYLMLENDEGNAFPVDTDTLLPFLKDTSLRLMILNACESGRSGGREAQLGLAPSLVTGGIPAVVAMQFPVPDRTAILLSREFYAALADNAPVDAALSEARKLIRAEIGADSFDWGIPVLFMRAPDGQLLHVEPPPKPKGETMFSPRTWAAIIAGIVVFLVLMGGITYGVLRQAGVIPTPEPTLVAAPAGENEFLVLVADFYTDQAGAQKIDVLNRLAPEIEAALSKNEIANARVVAVPNQPRNRQEALELSKRYSASAVVWGWYDDIGFEANVEIIDSPFIESLGGAAKLTDQTSKNLGEVDAAPETLRAYLRRGLSSQVNYVILYTVGRAFYNQGWDFMKRDDFTNANADFKTALRTFEDALAAVDSLPDEDRAKLAGEVFYTSIGDTYLVLNANKSPAGNLDKAIENFQHALSLQPNHANASYLLGVAYSKQGKIEESMQAFQQAVGADTSNDKLIATNSYIELGYLSFATDLQQAEAYWKQAYQLQPENVTLLQNLGFLEYYLQKYDEAIRLTQMALQLNPDDRQTVEVPLNCNLGLFNLAKGQDIPASQAYDAALAGLAKMDQTRAEGAAATCILDMNDLLVAQPALQAVVNPISQKLGAFAPTPAP
jgi:tetratricopeptide (TPR) repeat protein